MLKSALMFNVERIALKFIIVTETASIASFTEKVTRNKPGPRFSVIYEFVTWQFCLLRTKSGLWHS